MDILTLQDKIARGDYRSDRHPAVPFVTFEDVLKTSAERPVNDPYPFCGATMSVGDKVWTCHRRLGHVWAEMSQHDWASILESR